MALAERVEFSFEANLLVGRAGRNAVHWPRGPSIIQPDWLTGRMPESPSGTGGSYANMMLCVCFFSEEEIKKG